MVENKKDSVEVEDGSRTDNSLEQYNKIRRGLRLYLMSPKNGKGIDKPVMRSILKEHMDELYLDGVYYCLTHASCKDVFDGVNIGELIEAVKAGRGETFLAVLKNDYGIVDLGERLKERNEEQEQEREMTMLDVVLQYIKAEKRDGEWSYLPKRPLKSVDRYEDEKHFQVAIARRLAGVQKGETFMGYDIYSLVKLGLWYGKNPELLAEVNDALGFDFKETMQDLHPDWDYIEFLLYISEYLEAKARDNGKPKRYIEDSADFQYNRLHQEEVLKILLEVEKGERYKGFDISILVDLLKQGKLKTYEDVFKNMVGVDIGQWICMVDESGGSK